MPISRMRLQPRTLSGTAAGDPSRRRSLAGRGVGPARPPSRRGGMVRPAGRRPVMCRIAQMGLLRLLSNPAVLGEDVIARSEAWRVADAFLADPRVTWSDEPAGLEQAWRAFSGRDDRSHKPWTDDYLAAFAQAGGMTLATTDRGIASRYPSVQVETLS